MNIPESKYQILARKTWSDPEPDSVSISLELDSTNGQPFIVVSGHTATWLNPEQAHEAALFILKCVAQAKQMRKPRTRSTH